MFRTCTYYSRSSEQKVQFWMRQAHIEQSPRSCHKTVTSNLQTKPLQSALWWVHRICIRFVSCKCAVSEASIMMMLDERTRVIYATTTCSCPPPFAGLSLYNPRSKLPAFKLAQNKYNQLLERCSLALLATQRHPSYLCASLNPAFHIFDCLLSFKAPLSFSVGSVSDVSAFREV